MSGNELSISDEHKMMHAICICTKIVTYRHIPHMIIECPLAFYWAQELLKAFLFFTP